MNRTGCLVISLDFELHWGIRELVAAEDKAQYFRNTRASIPEVLQLFERYGIRATWAAVGMLLHDNAADADRYKPENLPTYAHPALNPYGEKTGRDESEDPFHYALSIARLIARTPGQELGTHTYSHYYCREAGQTGVQFRDDLQTAVRIAVDKGFAAPVSIVFPRNQDNPAYRKILLEAGIKVYRGNQTTWFHRADNFSAYKSASRRLLRLLDYFLPVFGHHTYAPPPSGELINLPASMFFWTRALRRPLLGRLHVQRICRSMRHAARKGQVYHLWWHPHNFGDDPTACLRALEQILKTFEYCRTQYGMESRSMGDCCV